MKSSCPQPTDSPDTPNQSRKAALLLYVSHGKMEKQMWLDIPGCPLLLLLLLLVAVVDNGDDNAACFVPLLPVVVFLLPSSNRALLVRRAAAARKRHIAHAGGGPLLLRFYCLTLKWNMKTSLQKTKHKKTSGRSVTKAESFDGLQVLQMLLK